MRNNVVIDLAAEPQLVERAPAAAKVALCVPFYQTGSCNARGCAKLHLEWALYVHNLPRRDLSKKKMVESLGEVFKCFGPVGAVLISETEGCVIFPDAYRMHEALKWHSVRLTRFSRAPSGANQAREAVVVLDAESGEGGTDASELAPAPSSDAALAEQAASAAEEEKAARLQAEKLAAAEVTGQRLVDDVAEPDASTLQRVWEQLQQKFGPAWCLPHRQRLKDCIGRRIKDREESRRRVRQDAEAEEQEQRESEGDEGTSRKRTKRRNWTRMIRDGFEWRKPGQKKDTPDGGRQKRMVCGATGCCAVRTVIWGSDLTVASDVTAPAHHHASAAPAPAAPLRKKYFPKLTEPAGWTYRGELEEHNRRSKHYACSCAPACPVTRVVVFDETRAVVVQDKIEGRHNH